MSWQEAVVRLIPTAVAAVAGFIAWREYRRKNYWMVFSPHNSGIIIGR